MTMEQKDMATLKAMTHADLTELLGKAMLDADLRAKLMTSTAPTLESLGFEANASSVQFFQLLQSKGFDHAAGQVKTTRTHDPIKLAGDM